MAKPIKSLELHYAMIQFLIIPSWKQKESYGSYQDAYFFRRRAIKLKRLSQERDIAIEHGNKTSVKHSFIDLYSRRGFIIFQIHVATFDVS